MLKASNCGYEIGQRIRFAQSRLAMCNSM